MIQVTSFGFRHGIPTDSDLVFDVRFLPNPNYIPEFKPLTGRHPSVARYIREFSPNSGIHRDGYQICCNICFRTTSGKARAI